MEKGILSLAVGVFAANQTKENFEYLIKALMIALSKGESLLLPGEVNLDNDPRTITPAILKEDGVRYYVTFTSPEQAKLFDMDTFAYITVKNLFYRIINEDDIGGLVLDLCNNADCFITKAQIKQILSIWENEEK